MKTKDLFFYGLVVFGFYYMINETVKKSKGEKDVSPGSGTDTPLQFITDTSTVTVSGRRPHHLRSRKSAIEYQTHLIG